MSIFNLIRESETLDGFVEMSRVVESKESGISYEVDLLSESIKALGYDSVVEYKIYDMTFYLPTLSDIIMEDVIKLAGAKRSIIGGIIYKDGSYYVEGVDHEGVKTNDLKDVAKLDNVSLLSTGGLDIFTVKTYDRVYVTIMQGNSVINVTEQKLPDEKALNSKTSVMNSKTSINNRESVHKEREEPVLHKNEIGDLIEPDSNVVDDITSEGDHVFDARDINTSNPPNYGTGSILKQKFRRK